MSTLPTTESKTCYDAWHAALPVDVESDALWHQLIRKHLDPTRDLIDRRVLEIGCGRGGFAHWLGRLAAAQRPREIVAADFSTAAVEKGREYAAAHGIGGIVWQEADIQNIPYLDGSFDTVFSCETIEHVPLPQQALSELARVLKVGGRLFLTTPNYLNAMGLYRAVLRLQGRRYTEGGQPINHFFVTPLVRYWLAKAGFNLLKIEAKGHFLPVPGRPPINMSFLEKSAPLSRWFAVHPCYVAEKK